MTSLYDILRDRIQAQEPVAMATVVDVTSGQSEGGGPGPILGAKLLLTSERDRWGSLGRPELDEAVARDVLAALESGRTAVRRYGPRGEARGTDVEILIEVFTTPPRMVICGAVDFTAALARVAAVLGYHVTICDARPVFVTSARFPTADELVVDWPNRYLDKIGSELGARDALCILTHDHKFDIPTIVTALATNTGYIGVMGSRRTHAERTSRLRAEGVDDEGLARLMAPIGVDIGARTPEETAIAICAEIIALRSGHTAVPSLKDGRGPIHRSGRSDPQL